MLSFGLLLLKVAVCTVFEIFFVLDLEMITQLTFDSSIESIVCSLCFMPVICKQKCVCQVMYMVSLQLLFAQECEVIQHL